MIDRHNILELLGNDKRKYHSCIITCYSFDFIFFEQRVLPKLRLAGIINVNIYVDAYQFEKQINHFVSSDLLNSKAGYSITPIRMKGAFHPKMLIAIGKSKGFLAIGSGNLTSSGLSSNEEIWSSFHTTDSDNKANEYFFDAIKYLTSLEKYVCGTNLLKLKWIKDNSLWYNQIYDSIQSNNVINDESSLFKILLTNENQNIYSSILEILPKQPNSIKILSPYYNSNGAFLEKLQSDFNPKSIHCIVDPLYGSIPYKFNNKFNFQFSNWNNLKREERYSTNRLHAKAFQFEYDDITYFLFGSANATIEAFGINTDFSINSEISVLTSSTKAKNYFKELGIEFPSKGNYDLSEYEHDSTNSTDNNEKPIFEIFIKNVELEANEVIIYCDNALKSKVEIRIEDANSNCIYATHLEEINEIQELVIENEVLVKPFRLAIYSLSKRISNFALIHQKQLLLNTNPDARIAQFNSWLNSDFFGDIPYEEIIDFISENSNYQDSRSFKQIYNKVEEDEEDIEVEPISEEEFNKNSTNTEDVESYNHYTTSRLEEFLNSLSFDNKLEDDITESIEEKAIIAGDSGLENENDTIDSKRKEVSYNQGILITYKIEKTIQKIVNALEPQKTNHEKNLKSENLKSLATIHQLNALLIGFHIILKKRKDVFNENRNVLKLEYDKIEELAKIEYKFLLERLDSQVGNLKKEVSFSVNENNVNALKEYINANKSIKLKYIDETPSLAFSYEYFKPKFWSTELESKSIFSYLKNGLSSYLLLLTVPIEYKDEKEKSIWVEKKRRLKLLSISSIISFNWPNKYANFKKVVLLNIFHYLSNDESVETFEKELEIYLEKLELNDFVSDENYFDVIDLYEQYLLWNKEYLTNVVSLKKELNKLSENAIIFHKKYGFAKIVTYYNNNFVNLETPLGTDIEEKNIFGFSDVFINLKPIYFQ